MILTATCSECSYGWRGSNAYSNGEWHEIATGHVVWYDEDDSGELPNWEGKLETNNEHQSS